MKKINQKTNRQSTSKAVTPRACLSDVTSAMSAATKTTLDTNPLTASCVSLYRLCDPSPAAITKLSLGAAPLTAGGSRTITWSNSYGRRPKEFFLRVMSVTGGVAIAQKKMGYSAKPSYEVCACFSGDVCGSFPFLLVLNTAVGGTPVTCVKSCASQSLRSHIHIDNY